MFRACTVSTVALAAILVAGCSQKGSQSSASAAAPAGAAASSAEAAATPSGKDDLGPEVPASQAPVLKAGYWEVTQTEAGKQPHVDKTCESGKRQSLHMGKGCSNVSFHKTLLGNFVMDAQCAYGPMSMGMHLEAKGDFQSHYSVDSTTKLKMGPNQPEQVHQQHSEARYLGACPPGEAPADDREGDTAG